jgi:hypothetical protein
VFAPPILEYYVLWHPDDDALGSSVAQQLMDHFHGPAYAGLAGGAVEVYTRSTGWNEPNGTPRPLPPLQPLPAGLSSAQTTIVIPVLGRGLANAFREHGGWKDYITTVIDADGRTSEGNKVAVLLVRDPNADISNSQLAAAAGRLQALPEEVANRPDALAREVAQATAQRVATYFDGTAPNERLKIFLSHTKQPTEGPRSPRNLVETVRTVLQSTHLGSFFDASDIQVSEDWVNTLDTEAQRRPMLMVRTDEYASRNWTQREVLAAKTNDMPLVCLHGIQHSEERGSFLLDHVPVVALTDDRQASVEQALNRLVDETLKRTLWFVQRSYLARQGFDWLPVHAPEPVTVVHWLKSNHIGEEEQFVIVHPDPPLTPTESVAIFDLCRLAGLRGSVEILTPRTFATRGGGN